jgi:hypothetical protein
MTILIVDNAANVMTIFEQEPGCVLRDDKLRVKCWAISASSC